MPKSEHRSSHSIGQIYLTRALDSVIEVACAVSKDFVKRPQLYTRVPDDVARHLANFRSLLGKHPEWPDIYQREFTSSRIVRRFTQDFASIRLSTIKILQGTSDVGAPIARRSLVEAAALLRGNVQPLEGTALSAVERANSGMLNRAITVLSSVSTAFGIAEIPTGGWPDGGIFSPQLGYLCEGVSQALTPDKPILQPKFSMLQRVAHYGSLTIDGVLNPSFTDANSDRVLDVVQSASAWAAALSSLLVGIDIARGWKEPQYREGLSGIERDILPPHPSGETDIEGTISTESARFMRMPGLGFSTETISGEICCSTGDLCNTDYCGGGNSEDDDCPTLTGGGNNSEDDDCPTLTWRTNVFLP